MGNDNRCLPTNTPIDRLLVGGLEKNTVANIYGPAGSGKTNVCICALVSCVNEGKKVIYIDTENSFSYDRLRQLSTRPKDIMNHISFFHPATWKKQLKVVKGLNNCLENAGLIIIDSFVSLYRLKLDQNNFKLVNKQLATQYSLLSRIGRENNIPTLVTNQVYTKGDKTVLTSSQIGKYWSKILIELKKIGPNKREAILRKHRSLPEDKRVKFKISGDGLKDMD